MKIVNFNNYTRVVDMSALDSYCHEHGRRVRYAKDEIFVQEGLVGRYMAFVEQGYFKYTTLTSAGNAAVVGFAFEGECVCDFNNSYHHHPSEVSIIAGWDAIVWQVEFNEIIDFIERCLPKFHDQASDAVFIEIYRRYLDMYRKTPKERYLDLLSKYPEVFNIVPIKDIASFLNVTPTYLSRIRRALAKTKFSKPEKSTFP